ncbi:hypothetical protein AGMMS50256_07730 [Betaproteobacteria bacterium]|nr:hypothetical protein AGMMS50256_07730 [Betaproteobacteria bacterium]
MMAIVICTWVLTLVLALLVPVLFTLFLNKLKNKKIKYIVPVCFFAGTTICVIELFAFDSTQIVGHIGMWADAFYFFVGCFLGLNFLLNIIICIYYDIKNNSNSH